MGGARLLCPRPQPDRLRARSRGARRLSDDRGRASQIAGDRRLYRRGDRRDRVRRSAAVVDTNVARVVARLHALEQSVETADREPRCGDDSRRTAGRLRPGDDGPRRDDLPPASAALRVMPAERRIARLMPAERPKPSLPRRSKAARPAAPRHRPLDRARRRRLAGSPAVQGAARRDGGASRQRMDRRAAAAARARRSAASATSSPISRSTLPWSARDRARRRRLVAAARPPR